MPYVWRSGWPKVDTGISPGRPPPMSIISSLSAADGGVGAKAGSEDAEQRVESEGVRSGPLTRMRAPRSA
jgi:hypothetical protein